MARYSITYNDLRVRVGGFLGVSTGESAPTGTNLTLVNGIIDRGIRQFLYPIDLKYGTPHQWSFLSQYWSFSTVNGEWKYPLPIDFSDILEDFSYDTSDALSPLQKRSGQQIKKYRAMTNASGWPEYFAIVPARYDIELGTTYELWLYPTPTSAYSLSTFYRIDPVKLSATTDFAIGGVRVAEAILECCLGVAETQEEDNKSTHHQQEAKRLIQTAIRFDEGTTATTKVGNLHHSREFDLTEEDLIIQDISFDRDIYVDDK